LNQRKALASGKKKKSEKKKKKKKRTKKEGKKVHIGPINPLRLRGKKGRMKREGKCYGRTRPHLPEKLE